MPGPLRRGLPALALLLLAGCSGGSGTDAPAPETGPVEVALPSAPPDGGFCAELVAGLPETLRGGLVGRPVLADATRAVAWGDPVVTLVCGAAPPDPTAEQITLGPPEGGLVTFAVDDVGAATAFTTVGTAVPVTVTVPDAYDATLLVPIAGALLDLR